jgi:hypothetical protein
MVPGLEQGFLHKIVRPLLVAAERHGEGAQATHFRHEGISQARRDFSPQLLVSALLKILKQSQEVLRYGLARDFVEHRAHVAADMSLQGRRKAVFRPVPGRLCRSTGAAILDCMVHSFAYARRFL